MAHQIKALVARLYDPSSKPRTDMTEEENQLQKVLRPPHMYSGMHAHTQKKLETEILTNPKNTYILFS